MEQEGWKVDTQVFAISAAVTVAFVVLGVVFDEQLATVVGDVLSWILTNLGWVFVLSTAAFLGFVVFLAVTPYGRIRPGSP
jgi:choline-glycine betaine transporter